MVLTPMRAPVPTFTMYQAMSRMPRAAAVAIDNKILGVTLPLWLPLLLASATAMSLVALAGHHCRVIPTKAMASHIRSDGADGVDGPLVTFFVRTGMRTLCFKLPDTTTIKQVKTMAFFREYNTGGAALEAHRLMKGWGRHLPESRTLKDSAITANSTLFLTAVGVGGGGPAVDPPAASSSAAHQPMDERELDDTSETATDETAAVDQVPHASITLCERVDQLVAHYLATLTVDDLKMYNPTSPTHHCSTDEDFQKALDKLKEFLASVVGKSQGVRRTYRYARGKDFGRMFCSKGLQNVWRAFRGGLCKGLMTDIDMKNAHPVILLWICDRFEIDCPKLREYVNNRAFHLEELGRALNNGSDREHCKRMFLMATNTDKKLAGVPYAFFHEYQEEVQETIQPALMNIEELVERFKPHAEEAARRKAAGGLNPNENGSFLNLVLCYCESIFLQEVKAFFDSVEIETAVLSFDGLMVYGDYYGRRGLLVVLHNRLKKAFGIDMHFDFKEHETTVLDDMPEDFDPTVVLGGEWSTLREKNGATWSSGILFNISDEHLLNETSRARLLLACLGQGEAEGRPFTWECAARKLWERARLDEEGFERAWAAAESSRDLHDGDTLRHYSRVSNEGRHRKICMHALGLAGCTGFSEVQLQKYFLMALGDDVLYIERSAQLCVWHRGRWVEDNGGNIMAYKLMSLVQDLFEDNLAFFERKLAQLVAQGRNDAAAEMQKQVDAVAKARSQFGNSRNKSVLELIKNHLHAHARRDDPFDNQPHVFAFTNIAYDLTRQRGDDGWFEPDKFDYLLMNCQKPWREPTAEKMANVQKWFEDIQPDQAMRKALISLLKSGLSGQQFQHFFVLTGGGGNGKDFLIDLFVHLLDKTPHGYAAKGHLDLLTKPTKSGPNPEARSLHKKRFHRFDEPNPGEKTEAIRLSNVNELTGCESIVARKCNSNDTDTRMHNTSAFMCNDPPACVGDKGNSAQRRWRWLLFPITFTADEADLKADPAKFKRIDPKLDDKDFVTAHYCALFKYLTTAEGVWQPGESLDSHMPEQTKEMAKEYLAQNDELSSWYLDRHEFEQRLDDRGFVVNFQSIREITELYQSEPIFTCMRKEDQRRFTGKKLKEEIEKNIRLKKYFVKARKVTLAATGKYNNKEGIIHHRLKRERDEDDDGAPAAQWPRLGEAGLSQFTD